ncbi:hypothetical protein [Nocardia sp. NPDC052566]|uniref:hypothetical protein n=1 Tax=Nocardia sp. NPDC052566 TaxID=3364330 RepID=UPI0037CB8B15
MTTSAGHDELDRRTAEVADQRCAVESDMAEVQRRLGTLAGHTAQAYNATATMAMNHNPHIYADDDTLAAGVRLHAHVAYDHLTGTLSPG